MGILKIIAYGLVIVFVLWAFTHIGPKIDAVSARRDADRIIVAGSGAAEVINEIIDKLRKVGTDTSAKLPTEDKTRIEKLRAIRDAL